MSDGAVSTRKHLRAARAALQLGIRPELLVGLICDKRVDGFCEPGRSGKRVWFVYVDEIERVKKLIGQS